MGWEPTPWRLAVFREWHRHEGMPLETTWNPLATTRLSDKTPINTAYNIGYGPGNWNRVPVRVYRDPEAGITATVETLALSFYPNIRKCFETQTSWEAALPEFKTYIGSEAYGRAMLDFMAKTPVAQPPPAPPAPPVKQPWETLFDQANSAAMKRLDLIHLGSGDFDTVWVAHELLFSAGLVPRR